MPAVGITTWIRKGFLGSVPFSRRWDPDAAGGGGKASGLSAGRVTDQQFKRWATGGAPPSGRGKASAACRHAVAALGARGIRPRGANAFLRHGGIKTHVDGLGAVGSTTVVIELKSTTKPLATQTRLYHTPCRRQPTVGAYANTEYTHHMLQLGWTTMAYRAAHPGARVTGIVVVAAADGARIVPLDEAFARPAKWAELTAAKPIVTGDAAALKRVAKFPDAAVAAVVAAAASPAVGKTAGGRVLLLACGGAAVATAKAKGSVTATDRKAMAAAVAGAAPAYYVSPSPSGWVVAPLIVAKQRRGV
jgi:hypothetical protein